jgi:broad specificity phosphatase PhoE
MKIERNSEVIMPTQLFLLRHGPTAAPAGCFVGSTDVALSGNGLTRLDNLIPLLSETDSWYCSPMRRTRQTLEQLQQRGCSVDTPVYDERLREIDFGRWEMQTFADIAAQDEDQLAAWNQYLDFVFPEGEAVADFIARVTTMLAILSESEHKSISVMTHGGVIRTMICLALGISPRNYLLFDVQPASLTVVQLFSRGGVLRGLNL